MASVSISVSAVHTASDLAVPSAKELNCTRLRGCASPLDKGEELW